VTVKDWSAAAMCALILGAALAAVWLLYLPDAAH
jgi:hypothetical protein